FIFQSKKRKTQCLDARKCDISKTSVKADSKLMNQSLTPQRHMTFEHNSSGLGIHDHINEPSSSKLVPNVSPTTNIIDPSLKELEFLFSHMYKEYFNAGNQSVSKPFAIYDNLQQQDTQTTLNVQPTLEPIIP
ncbi:hypothetical protein Tco_1139952, partial [Tanacetum coccineum]